MITQKQAIYYLPSWASLVFQTVVSACNAGDLSSIPGLGRFPGEGNGNPLQYSCLKNSKEEGVWKAIVHGVAKSWTRLSNFTFFLSWYTFIGIICSWLADCPKGEADTDWFACDVCSLIFQWWIKQVLMTTYNDYKIISLCLNMWKHFHPQRFPEFSLF